jgi:hypothetical protein
VVDVVDELLVEPLEDPLPEEFPPLPEAPLPEEPPDDPLPPEPLPELPEPELPDDGDDPEEEPDDPELLLEAGAGGLYITPRTSSSMRRKSARASCDCSTSAWPAVE